MVTQLKNRKTRNIEVGIKRDALTRDATALHQAVSELVRVYQFRDRNTIRYYDVTATQCYAVAALLANGPMTLNQLAAALRLDKSTASRVIDSLEEKKYVRRTIDPSDGRALQLEITARGKKLHGRIQDDLIEEMKVILGEFDPAVRKSSALLVARLAEAASLRFSTNSQD
jgi:DNA-binding MarR family transcriptional regulator